HTRFSRDWSSDVCSSDLARSYSSDGFSPHLTLARLNNAGRSWRMLPEILRRFPRQKTVPWRVEAIELMQSKLTPQGAKYSVIARSEERRVGKECRASWGT